MASTLAAPQQTKARLRREIAMPTAAPPSGSTPNRPGSTPNPPGKEARPALSHEEIVRALFDAFSRGDLQGAVELMHPDVVFQPMTAAVTRGGEPYRGHEGIRRYTEDVETHWRQLTIRLKQVRSAGRAVVALGLVSGSGSQGSFEDAPTTWVVKFKEGRVAHVQIFSDERYVASALVGERA
ncbi:MAG: nuclear transport factor 2 family protein [Solirubrobacteraceae bacterium]